MRLAPFAALIAVVLSGCTQAPDPVVETPVTQAPVEPVAVATGITISGTGMSIVFDDESTKKFAFSDDPAPVIEALSLAFGVAPATSHSEELSCQPSFDNAAWPGFGIRSAYANLPDGQRFAVTIDAATSGTVALSTTEGVAVGSDGDDAFAALEGAKRDRATDQGVDYDTVFFDRQPGGDSGGYLFAADDTVVTIIAPVDYSTLTC